MAIVRTDSKYYTEIAETLRTHGYPGQAFKPSEMAEYIGYMYDGVMQAGYDNGFEVGYKEGEQSEYNRFWDNFQKNGARTLYNSAFGGQWTAEIWKPKYPIRPTNIYMMFFSNDADRLVISDLVEFCEENNIVLDFSNAYGNATYALGALHTNHFGVLDFSCKNTSKTINLTNLFYSHNNTNGVKKIDQFVSSERTNYATTTFSNAIYLEEVEFSGVIDAGNFNVSNCTLLTHDSLMSIINALKDYSDTETTKTAVLGDTNLAKLDDDEKAIATEKGWSLV